MRWEYKVIAKQNWKHDDIQAELNTLGSDGWELVSFEVQILSCMVVLKRPTK